ncbi:MAG: hypothetical protein WEB88_00475 [Gemmatimonadota bacterium]
MAGTFPHIPGLASFWEQADDDCSNEHPLERELCHRMDAAARYCRRIVDARADGLDAQADQLSRQLAREEAIIARLRMRLGRERFPGRPDAPS